MAPDSHPALSLPGKRARLVAGPVPNAPPRAGDTAAQVGAVTVTVSANPSSTSARRRIGWGVMALSSAAIALVSYRYLFGQGPVPDGVATNRHFQPWIVLHAAGAATALLLGPVQFVASLRKRMPALHRIVGCLYWAGCLVGGVSALVLAAGVSAGPIAGMGFGALGAAWLAATGTAVRRIVAGDVASHRRWMVRSFALTFSAVTLRLYLPLASVAGVDFLLAYRVIAWMCWVPNLVGVEWCLRRPRTKAA